MDTCLNRFLEAQKYSYETALEEIKKGKKMSHWMWYIFPQIKGLGHSETAIYYEIKSLEEAKAYLEHDVLRNRLLQLTDELLLLTTNTPIEIFGYVDAMKLKSCMTLFEYISDIENFGKVLEKFYQGLRDEYTITICSSMQKDKIKKK